MRKINYLVPGTIPLLTHPTPRGSLGVCWAIAGAMMINWRQRTARSVTETINSLGTPWSTMLARGQGLAPSRAESFAQACGMRTERLLSCFPISGWLSRLQRYGPLVVITGNSTNFHARIMHGISEPPGREVQTFIRLIDPAGARRYGQLYSSFTEEFEAAAALSPISLIWHY